MGYIEQLRERLAALTKRVKQERLRPTLAEEIALLAIEVQIAQLESLETIDSQLFAIENKPR